MIELDDDKNAKIRNLVELGKYVRNAASTNKMNYVILDEIQRVGTIINPTLTEVKIVLAKDKATKIHLAPLSFEEYYHYIGGSKTEALYSYMQYGGMPLAVLRLWRLCKRW